MTVEKPKTESHQKEPEKKRSFKHLFQIIAKDLNAAAKAHLPKSLANLVTRNTKAKK